MGEKMKKEAQSGKGTKTTFARASQKTGASPDLSVILLS
jgi:hypothetical protein